MCSSRRDSQVRCGPAATHQLDPSCRIEEYILYVVWGRLIEGWQPDTQSSMMTSATTTFVANTSGSACTHQAVKIYIDEFCKAEEQAVAFTSMGSGQ